MIKRYIFYSLLIIVSVLGFLAFDIFSIRIIFSILFVVFLTLFFNTTDIFHKERFLNLDEDNELMDPKVASYESFKGSKKAVLLIHGFSSNPWLYHRHISSFEEEGYDVIAPRLPGHGTKPENFLQTSFKQYYETVESALKKYRKSYKHFHVIGISMGALLTLKLAEEHSHSDFAPTSITTLAAPIRLHDPRLLLVRFLSWIMPTIKGEWDPKRESDGGEVWFGYWDLFLPQSYSLAMALIRVREKLYKITLPHFLIHAKGDKDVPFDNLWEIAANTRSKGQEIWVPDLSDFDHSRHSLLLYNSIKEELFERIYRFLQYTELN